MKDYSARLGKGKSQKHGNQNKKIVKKKKFKNFAYLEYHELYLISEFFIYFFFFLQKRPSFHLYLEFLFT